MTVNGHDLEARYRQALLDQPLVSKVALADGRFVEVKDIYVNRTLLHEVVQKQPEREITVKLPVELWPKLRDERVVLIEGPAGMGKSTLTKHLVHKSGEHHLIPIWIPFRKFIDSSLSILEYLDQHYVPWLELSDLRVPNRADETGRDRSLGQWCYDQWQSGLAVLILDGLDEVFRHEERVAALKALPITGTERTRPATILTSRPLSQSLPFQMAKVEVQGLMPSDQTLFIERYRASLELTEEQVSHLTREITKQEQGRLRSLLTRPGHLIQILTTYAATNMLVNTETAVLDQLLESRLTITGRSQPSMEGDDAKKKRQVLLSLALHLLACRQGQRHTRAQLLALIQQVLWEHATSHAPLFTLAQATALLNDLTRNSGLLTEVEPEVYEFETVIWLQHLTGTALANQNSIPTLNMTETQVLDFLDKKAWDPEWEPVLKSWVGHRENPFPFFTRLMEKRHDDLARHRLGVAGRCLAEVQADLQHHAHYQGLAERIPIESFAVWKASVKEYSVEHVTRSLGKAWIEMEVAQAKLLALLPGPRSILRVHEFLDPDGRMGDAALDALAELGRAMPIAVQQALLARLAAQDKNVRSDTSRVFRRLGPAMPVAMQQALLARLTDPNQASLYGETIMAFSHLGTAMPDIVQQAHVARLADSDVYVRAVGLMRLKAMPVAMQLAFVARLVGPNEKVRKAAIQALRNLRSDVAASVQQVLVALLTDPDEAVREAAVEVLGGLGGAMSVPVQQALVVLLADPNEQVRQAAGRVLGRLGGAMGVPRQQALVARLADSKENVRWAAARAVQGLGTAMAIPEQQALVTQLADPYWVVQEAAWAALKELGAAIALPVQEDLVAQLAGPNSDVRWRAGLVLKELGGAMAVPVQEALVARLADPNSDVRWGAVSVLKELGDAMAVPAQEALVVRLADPDEAVRRAAVEALGGLGPAMPGFVQQALVTRLADPDEAVRRAAVEALGGLGPAMAGFVQEALVDRLTDSDRAVSEAAVKVLSSRQQQGLRLFLDGPVVGEGRLVSELSATTQFSDRCYHGIVHAPAVPAPPVFYRLPLTAL